MTAREGATPTGAARARLTALRWHDAPTREHALRTRALAERVARALGLGPQGMVVVRCAAVLHDIGKTAIPGSVLEKPGELDPAELGIVRRHPEIGAAMASAFVGSGRVIGAVLAHHERYDGHGYPAGLAGGGIPFEARLISVVDAYDAMTNDRPYHRALSRAQAVERLTLGAGSQFDPTMVEALRRALEDGRSGPPGRRGRNAGGPA